MTEIEAVAPPRRDWRDVVPVALVVLDAVVLAVIWVVAYRSGWKLIGDDSIIMLRAGDVFSTNTPLTGMPSAFSQWSQAADPYHPGPTPFWLLAPATAIFGTTELAAMVTTWVVAVGCVALSTFVARQIAGRAAAIAAVIVFVFFQSLLELRPPWTILTPVPAVQELLALCFVTWAIVAGRFRWWPVWVALASLVAHADLSFATAIIGLVAVAGWATWHQVAQARRAGTELEHGRRTLRLSVVVLVLCWLPMAIDAVVNDGGNLAELWRAAGAGVPGAGLARSAYALRYAATGGLVGPLSSEPQLAALVAALLACLVALAIISLRSHPRPERVALATTALAGLLGALVGQAFTPSAAGLQSLYLLAVEATGAFVWFGLVVLARSADAPRLRLAAIVLFVLVGYALVGSPPVGGSPAIWLLLVAAAIVGALLRSRRNDVDVARLRRHPALQVVAVVAVAYVAFHQLAGAKLAVSQTYLAHLFPAIDPLVDQVAEEVEPGRYQWFALGGPDSTSLVHGLAVPLADRGVEPRVDAPQAKYYGRHRLADGDELGVLYVTLGGGDLTLPGAQKVASWVDPQRDAGELAAKQEALVDAFRANDVQIDIRTSAYFIGSVVVGSGGGAVEGSNQLNEAIQAVGERYLADPEAIKDLPDGTIAMLLDQGLVLPPPGATVFFGELGTATEISVWLVPAPGAASSD